MADKDRESKHEGGVVLEERVHTKKPPMYKVLMHNDDYTTREFVVMVLRDIYRKNESDSVQIMMHVHTNGIGIAGVYTHEVAETKINRTMALAESFEFPLRCTMEPTE